MTQKYPDKKPYILIGYMGSGKSYVCKRLGAAMDLRWVDLDDVIEACAGKSISDIFADRGVTANHPIKSNDEGIATTLRLAQTPGRGLVFTNLVDFDMKYGHRRDVIGYQQALQSFDAQLATLLSLLRDDELVIITADHGCDPIFKGTDHTREYIPVLVAGPRVVPGDLGVRASFADIAATIAELLLNEHDAGSFAHDVVRL